jgi:hypothetical protein
MENIINFQKPSFSKKLGFYISIGTGGILSEKDFRTKSWFLVGIQH